MLVYRIVLWIILPIGSMYGIFSYIYHKNEPNVGKYTIHGSYGLETFRPTFRWIFPNPRGFLTDFAGWAVVGGAAPTGHATVVLWDIPQQREVHSWRLEDPRPIAIDLVSLVPFSLVPWIYLKDMEGLWIKEPKLCEYFNFGCSSKSAQVATVLASPMK